MKVLPNRTFPLLAVFIAVVLFSSASIAAIMGWYRADAESSSNVRAGHTLPLTESSEFAEAVQSAPKPREGKGRAKAKCVECGVVVSMEETDANDGDFGPVAPGSYNILVRMTDGSTRVISHASAGSWRPGERVILIDGAKPRAARKVLSWAK